MNNILQPGVFGLSLIFFVFIYTIYLVRSGRLSVVQDGADAAVARFADASLSLVYLHPGASSRGLKL